MGLFDFFKKSKHNHELDSKSNTKANQKEKVYCPVNGKTIPIDEVNDPVFSEKMMGDGFGVEPADGKVYSPVYGKVVSVFPTKHAVGLELENGVEILVHIGIDTVELDGGPFNTLVKEGDDVSPETIISEVDLKALAEAGKNETIIVVFTNMDEVQNFTLEKTGQTDHSQQVGCVESK